MKWKTAILTFGLAVSALVLAGCGDAKGPISRSGDDPGVLMGGGSSFVYPIMNRWTYDYYNKTKVQVNYQSLGSSGGIKQFTVKTLDFGATDAPMNEEQLIAAKDPVVHIPVVMGAVAVTYNVSGLKKPLTLSGQIIANIYLDKIKKWNDPAIAALNPGVQLPDADIVTVRRADGSGTTFIFADYLAKVSPEWKDKVGVGNSLDWPTDSIGGKGNEGVAAQVQRQANSLGYVELVYALESNLSVAAIVNAAQKAVMPSVESVTAAAAEMTSVPEDLRMSITNGEGAGAYPMAGLSWIVARETMNSAEKAESLRNFINYILSDEGQTRATTANYSRLPERLLKPALEKVAKIQGKQ